jgi:glycosyltransferase involved in cell wall biosynthesis
MGRRKPRNKACTRVLVLWSPFNGYMSAALGALAEVAEVSLITWDESKDTDYDLWDLLPEAVSSQVYTRRPTVSQVRKATLDQYDLLLVNGWYIRSYLWASLFSRAPIRVLFFDNPWTASSRQLFGNLPLRVLRRLCWDAAFVPGERQATYAMKLGFPRERIKTGGYAADIPRYSVVTPASTGFIFVGRLVERKGVAALAAAYGQYRSLCADPWSLTFFGLGPLKERLLAVGAREGGFVQPHDMPREFEKCACLILPSLEEHWGVAVHEAAASGLSLIASADVGSGDAFIRHGQNGFLVDANNVDSLLSAMLRMSSLTGSELLQFQERSRQLAHTVTPSTWVKAIAGFIDMANTE